MPCFSLNATTDSSSITVSGGTSAIQSFTVTVPDGKTPISGSYVLPHQSASPTRPIADFGSYPTSDGTGWTFEFENIDTVDHSVSLYVVYIDG